MDVRKKLVELLNGIIDGGFKWHSYSYESGEQLNNDEIASHLIDNGVMVQEWISVDDRLPDKPMKCLVYTKRGECGGYEITYYNQGFNLQYSNLTHWMPMPQPPKEVEQC